MDRNLKNRRKNYFINKKFQSDFIIKFCLLVITGAFISGLMIYFMSKSTVTTVFENSRLTIKSTADFILPAVLLSSAVMIIYVGLATIAVTLFTSHRIAGPLFRMQKDIEEVIRGNLKMYFSLRKKDELKAMANSLNEMTKSLRLSITAIKDSITELEKKAPAELNPEVEKLKEAVEKFIV